MLRSDVQSKTTAQPIEYAVCQSPGALTKEALCKCGGLLVVFSYVHLFISVVCDVV